MPGGGAGSGNGERDGIERAQRVRAGLTGLAAVLVLAGLAGAILNGISDAANGVDVAASPPALANTATAVETPNEPLAELGVAPPANVAAGTEAQ